MCMITSLQESFVSRPRPAFPASACPFALAFAVLGRRLFFFLPFCAKVVPPLTTGYQALLDHSTQISKHVILQPNTGVISHCSHEITHVVLCVLQIPTLLARPDLDRSGCAT